MTAPLLPVAISLIIGIVAGWYLPISERLSIVLLAICLVGSLPLRKHPRWQTTGIWLCTMLLGLHLSSRQIRLVSTLPQQHSLIVASEPVSRGKTLVMDAFTADGKKVQLRLTKGHDVHVGEGLMVTAAIKPVTRHQKYFYSHGYSGEVFATPHEWNGAQVSLQSLSLLQRFRLQLLRLRSQITAKYQEQGLTGNAYAITAAMTLGDRSALTMDARQPYDATGASHILALSGLHLGIIYWFITLLTFGRRWRAASQIVTILAIWAFAFMTGLSPSTVRAAVMLSVYALLAIGYRDRASVNVLAFTAIVMLVVQPLAVFDVGFQLSFSSVLGILLFFPLIDNSGPQPFLQRHPIARYLWSMAVLSVSAQLGVAPLIAYYFHHFPTYFLLANMVVVPAAYCLLLGAFLLLISGSASIASGLATLTTGTSIVLNYIAALPMSDIGSLHPTTMQTGLLYVAILCAYVFITHWKKE